ncbi:hypothetical protein M404DRAFT_996639 [Pisolithus tinctorius Marx 270]|uniref:Uncharacterized protein n=1 Tax=Pisolithus tinctorius Marx 270 TaxID=870435 RepID=A0A0C3KJM0_PISTI|nr:hypothetical protein M404DRAFT_996639 [Pisolithus tinctorius Marx 270]
MSTVMGSKFIQRRRRSLVIERSPVVYQFYEDHEDARFLLERVQPKSTRWVTMLVLVKRLAKKCVSQIYARGS